MIHKRSDKQWYDHRGNAVPREYVPSSDKKKESKVAKLFGKADKLSKQLQDFKIEAFEECDAIYSEMLAAANIKATARKGNYSVMSFDKSVKVEINVSDRIDFDDNITLSQLKLNEFILLKTKGADHELAALVNNAFTTRKGRLDKARVFSLLELNITHPIWIEAMELIRKSITVNSTVRYMEFARKTKEGKYEAVKLNFAAL